MNMVHMYRFIQRCPLLRTVNTLEYTIAITRRNGLYFIYFEPDFEKDPKFKRTIAFVTEFTDDIANLMDIYEFSNSKGAVEYDNV